MARVVIIILIILAIIALIAWGWDWLNNWRF